MPRGTIIPLGDTSKPEHRVLRISNLHFEATDEDVRCFFTGYNIVDWCRDFTTKSRRFTIAHVLLSSMEEVLRAERELDCTMLKGRVVRITKAKEGVSLTDDGMLRERRLAPQTKKQIAAPAPSPSLRPMEINDPIPDPVLPRTPGNITDAGVERIPFPEFPSAFHKNLVPPPPGFHPFPKNKYFNPAFYQANLFSPPLFNPALLQGTPIHMGSFTPYRLAKQSNAANPRHRVLLINNLHPEAGVSAIKLFFYPFEVVDFKRKYHAQIKKAIPLGFVMLESIEERNRAMQELNGKKLMGREVELEWAYGGVRVHENGFDHEKVVSPTTSMATSIVDTLSPAGLVIPLPKRTNILWNLATQEAETAGHLINAYPKMASSTSSDPQSPPKESWPPSPWNNTYRMAIQRIPIHRLPTWNSEVAHRVLRAWNLNGNDSQDRQFNMVTEYDWYHFKSLEDLKYGMSRR